MKLEALWNALFEISDCQTWCLIFLDFLFLVVFTAFLPKIYEEYKFLIYAFEINFKIYSFAKFYDLKPATTKMAVGWI